MPITYVATQYPAHERAKASCATEKALATTGDSGALHSDGCTPHKKHERCVIVAVMG
jgi:hypothetical protein